MQHKEQHTHTQPHTKGTPALMHTTNTSAVTTHTFTHNKHKRSHNTHTLIQTDTGRHTHPDAQPAPQAHLCLRELLRRLQRLDGGEVALASVLE